ncbi:WD repeat and HMG-box DNA-binding protein 1-like [Chenopodium quinoa]|uniref:WD repeat and HMG-box DNA-binding protein 1-like n=1 Tax=Chenopodium quinoa TaxID=63459 RepID=UPI000B78F10E|nr:WD repeat and HMG-box DNA-binding protein 1-like [Chenopodium quinoa]
MKVKSVKLRESHKNTNNNGKPSFCSVLWDMYSTHIVTSSSSDSSISIYESLLLSNPMKNLRHHRDGVTALALSPNSTCLASGSIDRTVKLYKFPSGEFQNNITRFTLPIRTLAFNKSGSLLAAAGDDEGIKLINTVDATIARVLKGHKGPVISLAFDPNNEYLASLDTKGTVIFWELLSGNMLHTLKGVAPDTGSDMSITNGLSWSPDGELLAVPGLKNDVVMFDRDTAEKVSSLRGDHVKPICFLSWSPNGKYLATSGLDNQVLIWDFAKKQDIDRQKFDERICHMAWKPTGNSLAVIDVMGKYGVWESVIPSSMKSPTEDVPNLQSKNNNGILFFDEEEQEPSTSASLSDLGEDDFGESVPQTRKRLRKSSMLEENLEEEIDEELNTSSKFESNKRPAKAREERLDGGDRRPKSMIAQNGSKIQEPFQPGATPVQPGTKSFLCYNMLGSITTMQHDGYSHIEIDFHDTSQGPRVPAMTDHFGFTMASLNENGSVLANPRKGDKNMSTLMYRPFSSWANNSEWSMRFEDEEVKAVALGTGWVAAATSANFLRIFTEGGLQRHILSLDGPVVTASGFKDKLAVVTHSSQPLPSNHQMLEFRVFNISNGTQPLKGCLPLSPGSNLTWIGFSEEGHLASYDSKGMLRVYSDQFGGNWLPLFSASKVRKPDENHWVVGLSAEKLFCIICKSPDLYPKVSSKPVLSLLDLSYPLASSDLGAEALEKEFIFRNTRLLQIQKSIEETEAAGMDCSLLDDEAFDMEAALDRCILRLIASCCNGDKLVRATELVKLLSMEKSVRGAIKLVTTLKLPSLAERFNGILEERLLNDTTKNVVLSHTDSHADASTRTDTIDKTNITPKNLTEKFISRNNTLSSSLHSNSINEPSEPITPSPTPKFTAPLFPKKAKIQEGSSFMMEQKKTDGLTTVQKATNITKDVDSLKKQENAEEATKKVRLSGASNPFAKSGNDSDVRPKNPFAKSSSIQEKSSLFDSIKKMKTVS